MNGMSAPMPRRAGACSDGKRPSSGAAGVLAAIALHAIGLGAVCLLAAPAALRAPPPALALAVVFAPPEAPAPDQTIAARTLTVPVRQVPAVLAPLAALHLRGDEPRPERRKPLPVRAAALPGTPAVAAPRASAASARPPAPDAHPAAQAAAGVPVALADWEARIRQAVQDAVVYPATARLQRREGRAQVRFDYDSGAVARASVVQTSHFAPLDAAALAAVTRASMPAAPADIGVQRRTMLVWVDFSLVRDE